LSGDLVRVPDGIQHDVRDVVVDQGVLDLPGAPVRLDDAGALFLIGR